MFLFSGSFVDLRINHLKSLFFSKIMIENKTNLSFKVYFHKKLIFLRKLSNKQKSKHKSHASAGFFVWFIFEKIGNNYTGFIFPFHYLLEILKLKCTVQISDIYSIQVVCNKVSVFYISRYLLVLLDWIYDGIMVKKIEFWCNTGF